jgi:hypothetical protein
MLHGHHFRPNASTISLSCVVNSVVPLPPSIQLLSIQLPSAKSIHLSMVPVFIELEAFAAPI